jgi:hypothetical protein
MLLRPRLSLLGPDRFERFANAEIIIRSGSSSVSVDPDTGDEVPSYNEMSLICMLRKAKKDPKIDEERGSEVIRTRLKGMAIRPLMLPLEVKIGLRCDATIKDWASGLTQAGRLQFIEVVQSPLFEEWQGTIGNRFEVYFTEQTEGNISWE